MKNQVLGLMMLLGLGIAACNAGENKTTTTSTKESDTSTVNSTTAAGTDGTSINNSGDYAAMADEYDRNSQAGKYRDARTGKPVKISVDRTSGRRMNAETNQPIERYIFVDNNDWWAYDAEGNRLSKARMEKDRVMYEGDDSKWVEHDVKFKQDGGEMKIKGDGIKIKTEKDGDMKIKTDDKKIKIEDGKVKEKDN